MRPFKKNPKADLNNYYTLFFEIGLILALLILLALTKVNFNIEEEEITLTEVQDVVHMEEIIQTEQEIKPAPLPRPRVPVAVPNDEVISDEIINLDAELTLGDALEIPPPPPSPDEEAKKDEPEDFFIIVEEMPELIGGISAIQEKIEYPEMARKAEIEGLVIVQFIVNEKGEVENPVVVRGIGGGCDEEAIRVIKELKFKPGRQRGVPVRVQFSLPVHFILRQT